jgi:hypothetical protein
LRQSLCEQKTKELPAGREEHAALERLAEEAERLARDQCPLSTQS